MEKILRESGFPIFGGKFVNASFKLVFWPPFCYRIGLSEFRFFLLYLGSFGLLWIAHFRAKLIQESTFFALGSIGTPLTTKGSETLTT